MKNVKFKLKEILNNFKNTSFNNKRIIVLTVISILALMALVSTTFAMFIVSDGTEDKVMYSSGDLLVSFNDENGNAITINPAKPVSDSYGMTTKPYTFTITNNGTLNATYEIVLTDEVISNPSGLTNEQVKENIKIQIDDNNPILLSELDNNTIASGIINPQKTKEFSIRLWIKREANNDIENTSYSAKVAVTGKATVKKDLICEVGSGSTLACNMTKNTFQTTSLQPITRENILSSAAKKTFTVKNTSEEKVFVHISMEDMLFTNELKRYDFMWSLYEGDKNVSNGTFADADATSTKEEIAPYQVFESGEEKTYNLYVWIEKTGLDQSSMLGQIFDTAIKTTSETYHTSPETCFTFENGTITGYDVETCGTDVIIPKTIGGVEVTSIGREAFNSAGTHPLTSVVIPNSVTSIGDGAFGNYGSWGFSHSPNLFIPNSVTTIGKKAFEEFGYGAIEPISVSIPNSVTEIGDEAFYGGMLFNVFIPNSVTTIGKKAFGENMITNPIIIPNSVTSIGAHAFRNLSLKSVIIQRPSAEGITFGIDWNCAYIDYTYPDECEKYFEVIYNPNY